MDLNKVAMRKLIAVADKNYQFTVIEIGEGLFAKITSDDYNLYSLNFVGEDGQPVRPDGVLSSREAEARLSGTFTSHQKAIRVVCPLKSGPP